MPKKNHWWPKRMRKFGFVSRMYPYAVGTGDACCLLKGALADNAMCDG